MRSPFKRFSSWLSGRLAWLDQDDPTDGPFYDEGNPQYDFCICRPGAVGKSGERCGVCGGQVIYLAGHPTDAAAREAQEAQEAREDPDDDLAREAE